MFVVLLVSTTVSCGTAVVEKVTGHLLEPDLLLSSLRVPVSFLKSVFQDDGLKIVRVSICVLVAGSCRRGDMQKDVWKL